MRFCKLLVPVVALGVLAACGDNANSDSAKPSGTAADAIPKPAVKLPTETPTDLVITDITKGTGTAAASGDTVIVHYVGVRSVDGAEFDNNFDTGEPFSVTIGVAQVIKGWDEGLVGMKLGGRRQLDIPAEMAYGDHPPSTDVIQPGDALSFVIDLVGIIPKTDPAKTPDISIPATPNQADQTFTDLIVGDGPGIEAGQTIAIQLLAFSAADGKLLDSSWDTGAPLTFAPGGGQSLPFLEEAVAGMKVGGRRQVDIPFAEAFGQDGNPDLGLPASTDLIMVIDLIAAY
ncbi:MAG: FKBP-type peptidyl-prolyl cis-trans isomerase [Ilumatobacteraceae bacterium]